MLLEELPTGVSIAIVLTPSVISVTTYSRGQDVSGRPTTSRSFIEEFSRTSLHITGDRWNTGNSSDCCGTCRTSALSAGRNRQRSRSISTTLSLPRKEARPGSKTSNSFAQDITCKKVIGLREGSDGWICNNRPRPETARSRSVPFQHEFFAFERDLIRDPQEQGRPGGDPASS